MKTFSCIENDSHEKNAYGKDQKYYIFCFCLWSFQQNWSYIWHYQRFSGALSGFILVVEV